MQVISVAIQKGGTGKTSTAAALAQAATARGERVLLIDLDPQGNLSFALGADETKGNTFLLLSGKPAADQIQETTQGIDIIPAAWELSTITTAPGSARRLQKAIQPIRDRYSLIIIDTPPTPGELQYNALQASTGIIIPLMADAFSVNSLYQITATANAIMQSNPELSYTGVVVTKFSDRSTISKQMRDTIKQEAQELSVPYLGEIRNGVVIQEAAALQVSLYEYGAKSKPAADYMAVYEKITKR